MKDKYLEPVRSLLLSVLGIILWCSATSIQAQLSVARVNGWGTYDNFFEVWELDVTPGYLYEDCTFVPNPGAGHTIPNLPSRSGFIRPGNYYVATDQGQLSNLRTAFPAFTFEVNPSEPPDVLQQIRVICNGTSPISFSAGATKWRLIKNGLFVKVRVPQINNNRGNGTSGTIYARLIAGKCSAVSKGRGKIIAQERLGELPAGYLFRAHSSKLRVGRTPRGKVCTALVLYEFGGGIHEIRRYRGKNRFR